MTYKAALIGCGKIGSLSADDSLIKGVYTHAGAYAACPDTTLVAVCDNDEKKVIKCSERWEVNAAYTNIISLLEEQKPQIVSICTPDVTHANVLDIVLSAPSVIAILIEKPLSLDLHEAKRLLQIAKNRDILLAVNYSRRYSKGHAKIQKMIQLREIGAIQNISGFYTKGIFHNGTHWIDLARWLIGDINYVYSYPTYNKVEKLVSDPVLNAYLKFENGAVGFLHGLDADAFSLFEMDIVGTKGRIRLIDSGHKIEYYKVCPSQYYNGYTTIQKTCEENGELENTMLNAVNNLVFCLKNGGQPQCSGIEGLIALQVATALVESAKNGLKMMVGKSDTCPA